MLGSWCRSSLLNAALQAGRANHGSQIWCRPSWATTGVHADGYFGRNSEAAIERTHEDGSKRTYYWGEGSNGFSITEQGFDELGLTCL